MLAMATLDWIVLGVLALSLAVGAWRGLVYELLYGVGWVVAFFITRLLVPQLAAAVRPYASSWSPTVLYAAVFIVLFIALVFAWGLVAVLAKKLVQMAGLRPVDRVLGACFGAVRGVVLLLVLALAVQAGRWHSDGWWSQSYAGPRLQQVLAYALPYGGGLGGAAGWDWQRWVPGPS